MTFILFLVLQHLTLTVLAALDMRLHVEILSLSLESAVCWLAALRPSNMLVYLRDGSAQTILCAATLR